MCLRSPQCVAKLHNNLESALEAVQFLHLLLQIRLIRSETFRFLLRQCRLLSSSAPYCVSRVEEAGQRRSLACAWAAVGCAPSARTSSTFVSEARPAHWRGPVPRSAAPAMSARTSSVFVSGHPARWRGPALGQLEPGYPCQRHGGRRTAGFKSARTASQVLQQGVELGNFLILALAGGHGGDLLFKSAFVAVSSSSWAVVRRFLLVGGILAHESRWQQQPRQRNAHNIEMFGFGHRGVVVGFIMAGDLLFGFWPALWFIIARARQKSNPARRICRQAKPQRDCR